MNFKKTALALLALTFALGLAACNQDGPAEEAGEEIDNAAENLGDEIENVTE